MGFAHFLVCLYFSSVDFQISVDKYIGENDTQPPSPSVKIGERNDAKGTRPVSFGDNYGMKDII